MFDIGMGELALLAVVGLLVLGPERLPRVARTAGALLRKARQSWQSVRADIERELNAEELKQTIKRAVVTVDPTPDLRSAIDALNATTPTRDASEPEGVIPPGGNVAPTSVVDDARR